ncbi:MAG: septum formation initiator family protein [Defluviitaleaceae bacterium]|nr:septum formation initiator family protein [Defluviitaleaceae bacterium]
MEEKKKPKKRRRFKLPKVRLRYGVFWVFIIAMISAFLVYQVGQNNALQEELNQLNGRIAQYQAQYDNLYLQLTFFDSDVYIEELARERLGMVRPNELVFRNIAAD